MKSLNLTASLAAAAALGASLVTCMSTPVAEAARNSSGTYSLYTPGNPVTTGSTIASSWANNTLNDIGAELTNSLDRNGRGAMLAPLQCSNGSVSAPSLTFSAETGSGLYRAASHDVRMSVNGADVQKWLGGGSTFVAPLTVSGANVTVTGSGGSTDGLTVTGGANSGANGGLTGTGASAGAGTQAGFGLTGVGGNGTAGNVSGGPGIRGFGGASSGSGAAGIGVAGAGGFDGGTSAVGGWFAAGITATASVYQDALAAPNGALTMDGSANPNSGVGFKNRLTPKNIVKAWAHFTSSGTTATLVDGFNVTVASSGSNGITNVSFVTPMANANYAVVLSSSNVQTSFYQFVNASLQTANGFPVWCGNGAGANVDCLGTHIYVEVMGAQ